MEYLPVMIDPRIKFRGYLDYTREKAANTTVSLTWIMLSVAP